MHQQGTIFTETKHPFVQTLVNRKMKDLFVEASGLIKAVSDYVNPVGRMYLKFQFIFRLLFSGVMLSDIMKTELVCDTMQIGCKDMCLNRFAPLTFPKLWQLEMYFMQQLSQDQFHP